MGEQRLLAAHDVAVVELESRIAAEAVEHVVGVMRRGPH